jgi:sugar phosphate isomerase/epimerase
MLERDLVLWWGSVNWTSVERLAQCARQAGFQAITVTPAMYYEAVADARGASRIRDLLSELDVSVTMIDPLIGVLPGSPRPEDAPPRFRRLLSFGADECFRAAEGLGAHMVCLAGFMESPAEYGLVLDACAGAAQDAAGRGLGLTLEFIPNSPIPDLSTALRLCHDIALPNVGVMFDTWHFARAGGTTEELRAVPPGAITGLQVSDRIEPAATEAYVPMEGRLLPGKGELPLAEWLAILLSRNPGLDVGVEVFSSVQRNLPVQDAAKQAGWAMRSVLSAASKLQF